MLFFPDLLNSLLFDFILPPLAGFLRLTFLLSLSQIYWDDIGHQSYIGARYIILRYIVYVLQCVFMTQS